MTSKEQDHYNLVLSSLSKQVTSFINDGTNTKALTRVLFDLAWTVALTAKLDRQLTDSEINEIETNAKDTGDASTVNAAVDFLNERKGIK